MGKRLFLEEKKGGCAAMTTRENDLNHNVGAIHKSRIGQASEITVASD